MSDLARKGDIEARIVDPVTQDAANILDVDGTKRLAVDANLSFQADALVVIGDLKNELWDGKLFETSGILTLQTDVTYDWLIKVNASYNLHIDGTMTSELGHIIYIYEAPTTSADGTLVTPVNSNRASSEVLNSLMYAAPTVTDVGTVLRTMLFPGSNQSAVAGEQPGFIFKYGVNYLIRVKSLGNGNKIGVNIFMYERAI